MHTLDASTSESWLVRDLKLVRDMLGMMFGYFVVGGRLRREYRRRERRGETLWLDEVGIEHREAPLRHR